jgi:hypothetical protein
MNDTYSAKAALGIINTTVLHLDAVEAVVDLGGGSRGRLPPKAR